MPVTLGNIWSFWMRKDRIDAAFDEFSTLPMPAWHRKYEGLIRELRDILDPSVPDEEPPAEVDVVDIVREVLPPEIVDKLRDRGEGGRIAEDR